MNEIAQDRPKTPRPVRPSFYVACTLEAGIVATFLAYRSIVGLLLCLGYAYFSAILSLAFWKEE